MSRMKDAAFDAIDSVTEGLIRAMSDLPEYIAAEALVRTLVVVAIANGMPAETLFAGVRDAYRDCSQALNHLRAEA